MGRKATNHEIQKRIQVVSLLLRRKSTDFIIKFAKLKWGVEKVQAYNYIKDAKVEWAKYFAHVKKCGMDYHVTQLRDIKDQAYRKKTTVGTGKDKKVVKTPNLGLVLDIAKEEAKLMGVYPAEKHDVNVTTSFAEWVKKVKDKKDNKKIDSKEINNMKVIKSSESLEELQTHRGIVRRVSEMTREASIVDAVAEEPQTHNKIIGKAQDNGGEESRKASVIDEEFEI